MGRYNRPMNSNLFSTLTLSGVKGKAIPVTGREGPLGCEMAWLSASRDGRSLPPGRFLILVSLKGSVDPRATVRLEGLGQLKNTMTSGIEPATFRLVAYENGFQRLESNFYCSEYII
jgi:hypothetical protein